MFGHVLREMRAGEVQHGVKNTSLALSRDISSYPGFFGVKLLASCPTPKLEYQGMTEIRQE
jgi:hypothetical protein